MWMTGEFRIHLNPKAESLTSLGKGTRNVPPSHIEMYLDLEEERPGLRGSFLISGLKESLYILTQDKRTLRWGSKQQCREILRCKDSFENTGKLRGKLSARRSGVFHARIRCGVPMINFCLGVLLGTSCSDTSVAVWNRGLSV
ncbi:hypothetical protein TNCV_1740361 [Trichonephila clavipes]|uniref:Uncharacterized protein n=1 Tax=Trichonephila clavipes TaxID=2585209 RepID=A0A8X6UTM2_TRICX|nr:hypothetical protein TNCV_1740361 [Trichonephila clavipes]